MATSILPVYIINLATSKQRCEEIKKQFKCIEIEYERFEAVDGCAISPQILDVRRGNRWPSWIWDFKLTPPEFGCYFSHLLLWEAITLQEDSGAFIFEDDVVPSNDLLRVLQALSEIQFDKPVVIKLHPPWDYPITFFECGELTDKYRLAMPHCAMWSTSSYYINKKAARILVDKRQIFLSPVDIDLYFQWETGVDILTVIPNPLDIADDNMETSAIARYDVRSTNHRGAIWRIKRYLRARICPEVINAIHLPARLWRWRKYGKPTIWAMQYIKLVITLPLATSPGPIYRRVSRFVKS